MSNWTSERGQVTWLILVVLTIELYHADVKLDFVRQKSYATNPPALNWFLEHSTDDRILGLGGDFPSRYFATESRSRYSTL
jgi:hypothetical protein